MRGCSALAHAHPLSPLTSRRSRLTKLLMANPSMISSSCELDSRLLRRGGRDGALAAAERGAFFAASLAGLSPSLSEQEEFVSGLRASLLPASRSLRTLSRLERHIRACFTLPSILAGGWGREGGWREG